MRQVLGLTPGTGPEADLEPGPIGSSLAEYARNLEPNRSEEEDGLSDAAVYTNRAAQKVLGYSTWLNLSLGHHGLAAASASANLGSQAAEQYLRMDEDKEPSLELGHEVGRLAREDAEQLVQESEITAVERPHTYAEHGSYDISSRPALRDQVLYYTDGERTQLEFYREDSLKDIADSAPYMCVKADACPEDILDGETDTDSISLM